MRGVRWAMILLCIASPTIADQHAQSDRATAFGRLRSLVGTWVGAGAAAKGFTVRFELVAGGSTLMETLSDPNGSAMVTMYNANGPAVSLTHYCSMGDQPRMRGELSADSIRFTFIDVANLKGPETPHMHDLTISWNGPDRITERWVVASGAKRTPMVLDLKRTAH